MAEKRAKDRVVLKLVGLHGLVYSEDESDFTESKAKSRDRFKELSEELKKAQSLPGLAAMWKDYYPEIKSLPDDWQTSLTELKDSLKHDFEEAAEKEPAE